MGHDIEGNVVVITGASSGPGESKDGRASAGSMRVAFPAESVAHSVAFATGQPEDVDVHEILFRPTRER
jgi:NADP-dependent 3-hydroxy acid dehydrogenase YdfG